MSFHNSGEDEDEKHDENSEMLLNLTQKSSIFVADQTPTPTRLIKNCEEVGLFDDLRHVNPFEETFRRACEQNANKTPSQAAAVDEDSLHTPQFDAGIEGGITGCEMLAKPTLDTPVALDVAVVDTLLTDDQHQQQQEQLEQQQQQREQQEQEQGQGQEQQQHQEQPTKVETSTKYRPIVEKSSATSINIVPSSFQFIQPQLITVQLSASNDVANEACTTAVRAPYNNLTTTTYKPFILPKFSTSATSQTTLADAQSSQEPQQEPSSASLTPTSQLPIKERLKAILSHGSKSRIVEWPQKSNSRSRLSARNAAVNSHLNHNDDCLERRRAASTRYRHKIRNEHKELRRRNTELQAENAKLRERVKQLEVELLKSQSLALQPNLVVAGNATNLPAQIQIPASTIHLVMNIPKLVVPIDPENGQPALRSPFVYRVEKK